MVKNQRFSKAQGFLTWWVLVFLWVLSYQNEHC